MQELIKRIRPVTDEDTGKLPVFSYSKIEVFKNCPMQYKIKYIDKKFSFERTLATDVGNLCHYILEQKGKMKKAHQKVDYKMLMEILQNGTTQTDEKTKEPLLGVKDLKIKYFDKWYDKENPDDLNYDEKIKVFIELLHKEMEDDDWQPYLFEHEFEFVWNNKYIIHGFIDRIDKRIIENGNGESKTEYRVIDYKTSKKTFDEKKLPTALQFGIYALAVLNEFKVLPVLYEYHFVLLDKTQLAMTKGYEKRLLKSLDAVFESIDKCTSRMTFIPSPTPLCHWCSYCATNPDAKNYKNECEYYSLWTKQNKTFEVNKKWNAIETTTEDLKKTTVTDTKRKLIF